MTAPAVPPPAALTAAAWAFAAAAPVTGFSALSCAALPGAEKPEAGGRWVLGAVWVAVLVLFDVAALARLVLS